MDSPASDALGWLLARGILNPEQVALCQEACGPSASPAAVLRELIARGVLDPLELAGFSTAPPRSEVESTIGATTPRLPFGDTGASDTPTIMDAAPPQVDPSIGRLGHYQLQERLGSGGTGVVYRAWDAALSRVVAVKLLEGSTGTEDPRSIRFLREARMAARLHHPRIVQVHDVGEGEGRPFIVMDFIQGQTLRRQLQDGRVHLREGARLVAQVAEGLAFAHEHGVVHRDVKPENILVDAQGDANIADFGLAVEMETSTRMTVTGQVLGTPSYMSPEQAEGDLARIGPPTDIYGAGVVLYEVLTGHVPFSAATPFGAIYQILNSEATPPSKVNSRVPRDLEVICMKCLEKEPSRRYPSAAGLAADLHRYLDGEAIEARPLHWTERAWRRLRRNPGVAALCAALVVAAGTIAVSTWHSRAAAESARRRDETAAKERETLIQGYLREIARSGDALVEASLARRALGDVEGSRRFAEELKEPVEQLIRLAPGLAEPWYHQGRMARALLHMDQAEAAQDAAIQRAEAADAPPGSRAILPLALYERGVLRATRFLTDREERRAMMIRIRTAGLRSEELPPVPTTEELMRAYPELDAARRDAISDLERILGEAQANEDLEARGHAAQGFLAVLRAEADAAQHLERAMAADKYMPEMYTFRARLEEERGEWGLAADWYHMGHEVDKGYLSHLLGKTRALWLYGFLEDALGRSGANARRIALTVVDECLQLYPSSAVAYELRGLIHQDEADALMRIGQDPSEAQGEALLAFDRSLSIDPMNARVVKDQGCIHLSRGDWLRGHGEDPRDAYRDALAAADRALRIDPSCSPAADTAGWAWIRLADDRQRRGEDPKEELQRALTSFERAIAIHPRSADSLGNLAVVHQTIGEWRIERGEDPSDAFQKALATFQRALSVEPVLPGVLHNQATVYCHLGEWRCAQRQDPLEAWEKAEASFKEALSINPRLAETHCNLARLNLAIGRWHASRDEDPREAYSQAAAGFEAALSNRPNLAEAESGLGDVSAGLGDRKREVGEDPTAEYERALAGYGRALVAHPGLVEALAGQANVYAALAEWRRSQRKDPRDDYEKALAAYSAILTIDSTDGPTASHRGGTYRSMGDWQRGRGEDPNPTYERALADYEAARALRPRDSGPATGMGKVLLSRGDWRRSRGEDPGKEYDAALDAFKAALSLDPDNAFALLHQSIVYRGQGEWKQSHGQDPSEEFEKALTGLARALAIRPRFPEASYQLASLHRDRGLLQWKGGLDPTDSFEQARVEFERALTLSPVLEGALNGVAHLHKVWGDWRKSHGEDPGEEYEKALAGYQHLLEVNPDLWQVHANRGVVFDAIGRFDEAIASYESALRIRPDQPQVKALLEAARTKKR